MRTVPLDADNGAILEVLEEWTELLAAEDYAGRWHCCRRRRNRDGRQRCWSPMCTDMGVPG